MSAVLYIMCCILLVRNILCKKERTCRDVKIKKIQPLACRYFHDEMPIKSAYN